MKRKLKYLGFLTIVIIMIVTALLILMKPVEGYSEIRDISYRDYDDAKEKSFGQIAAVTNARGWNTWYQASCVHPGALNNDSESIELYLIIDINPDGDNPIGGTYTAKTVGGGLVTGDLSTDIVIMAVSA